LVYDTTKRLPTYDADETQECVRCRLATADTCILKHTQLAGTLLVARGG